MIKLFAPYVPPGTADAIKQTLASGQLAQGPCVDEFERRFGKLFGHEYCVSTNSGTAALELAYDLIGLKKGDEVITTPLTCTATNIPLIRRGVKIIWADILKSTLCINPVDVHAKLTSKTRMVVQVHLGGIKADCGTIHVPIVSDACQALGIFNGNYTCCSFQAIKHITTGDGGMLVLDNEAEYKKAKLMRWFGIDRELPEDTGWSTYKTRMMCFDINLAGGKMHMNDIAATMGLVALRHYTTVLRYRERMFDIYRYRLDKDRISGLTLVDSQENTCWLATVLVEKRDDFARKLFGAGIETNIVQVRNDTYKIFGGVRVDLPVLDSIEGKYISLPLGMHTSEDEINYICDTIIKGW